MVLNSLQCCYKGLMISRTRLPGNLDVKHGLHSRRMVYHTYNVTTDGGQGDATPLICTTIHSGPYSSTLSCIVSINILFYISHICCSASSQHYVSLFEEIGFIEITTHAMPCNEKLAFANRVLGIDIDASLPNDAPERSLSPVLLICGTKVTKRG